MKTPTLAVALVGLFLTSAAAFEFPDCKTGPLSNNTVCNVLASPKDRAAALVQAMTLSEKLVNLVDNARGAKRIGLPPYEWWNEGLHGVATSPGVTFNRTGRLRAGSSENSATPFSYATSFPNTITTAAAFDDDLVHRVATVISTEARAFINAGLAGLDFWTPNVNPYKDPRWGRGYETPGEDPVRIKGYAKAFLAGLEGNNTAIRKVIATCKHFAAYDLERWKGVIRYGFDAIVTSQDLAEYYLPPFQQCARDSQVGSIMCSYNSLNGTPACASEYLMTDILRNHWGWTADNNFVTTDCNAVKDFLPSEHNFSATAAEAAAVALNAGTDTVCEVSYSPPLTDIVGAFNQSLLPEATVDRALKRLYEGLIRAGYFDHSTTTGPYDGIGWADVSTKEARSLALQAAVDGLVLLKNDGTLPLRRLTRQKVALIGHWVSSGSKMLGGYSGIPPYLHTPEYAARELNLTYYTATGPVMQGPIGPWNISYVTQALTAADQADVILYFGGTDQSVASEDRDRETIAWPAGQLAQLTALSALGKPLIVIQLGDQLDSTPLLTNPNISAIIWAGYPGQSGGTAVFNVLRGRSAPAGRLPVTQYPASYVDAVPMTDMSLRPHAASPGRTYRWFNKPILPFGYGLHYTHFNASIGGLVPSSSSSSSGEEDSLLGGCASRYKYPDTCPFASASVRVTNTGNVTSDYVALVFVTGEFGPKPYPLKTLAAYTRIRRIRPGQTRLKSLALTLGSLARVDLAGNTVLYPGKYRLSLDVVGDDGMTGTGGSGGVSFDLEGDEAVLDWFPQPGAGGNSTRTSAEAAKKVWNLQGSWKGSTKGGLRLGEVRVEKKRREWRGGNLRLVV